MIWLGLWQNYGKNLIVRVEHSAIVQENAKLLMDAIAVKKICCTVKQRTHMNDTMEKRG